MYAYFRLGTHKVLMRILNLALLLTKSAAAVPIFLYPWVYFKSHSKKKAHIYKMRQITLCTELTKRFKLGATSLVQSI